MMRGRDDRFVNAVDDDLERRSSRSPACPAGSAEMLDYTAYMESQPRRPTMNDPCSSTVIDIAEFEIRRRRLLRTVLAIRITTVGASRTRGLRADRGRFDLSSFRACIFPSGDQAGKERRHAVHDLVDLGDGESDVRGRIFHRVHPCCNAGRLRCRHDLTVVRCSRAVVGYRGRQSRYRNPGTPSWPGRIRNIVTLRRTWSPAAGCTFEIMCGLPVRIITMRFGLGMM